MRESRSPDHAQRARGRLLGPEVGVAACDAAHLSVRIREIRHQCRRHALLDAKRLDARGVRPVPRGARGVARFHTLLEEEEIGERHRQLRQVKLVNARRADRLLVGAAQADGFDGLVQQLRLPGIEAAGRCVVGEAVTQHGLQRLHTRDIPEQGHEHLAIDIEVVIVALDVIRSAEALDVGSTVRQEHAGHRRGGVLVLVLLVEHAECRPQLPGRQLEQRTRQRSFRDCLVHGSMIRRIDCDVIEAFAARSSPGQTGRSLRRWTRRRRARKSAPRPERGARFRSHGTPGRWLRSARTRRIPSHRRPYRIAPGSTGIRRTCCR